MYGSFAHMWGIWTVYRASETECKTSITTSVSFVFNVNNMSWHSNQIKSVLYISVSEVIDSWWRHQMETFSRYWPFMRGILWSSVVSPTKTIDTELWCFLWSGPEQTVWQTIETPGIWDAITLINTSLKRDMNMVIIAKSRHWIIIGLVNGL